MPPTWPLPLVNVVPGAITVNLGQLRAFAKRNQDAVKVRAALATLLFGFLSAEMERPAETVKPTKVKRARPSSWPATRMAA